MREFERAIEQEIHLHTIYLPPGTDMTTCEHEERDLTGNTHSNKKTND